MSLFAPTEYVNSIYDIDIKELYNKGIRVLVLDIDNTLVPTSVAKPTQAVISWIEKAKTVGMKVVLSSNNSSKRVGGFNDTLKLFAVHRALKPFRYGFRKIAEEYKVKNNEICMIGDQIFTDILGANHAGVMSILVLPLSTDEGIGVRFKRYIENIILKKNKMDTYCLIGNPVSHSKSPLLHNIVYDFHRIKARYMLCLGERERLGQIVEQFINSGVKGFNITVPFKQDIIQFLDFVSDDAKRIGAVNTVKITGGKCYGYNTDGDGFVMQLKSDETEIKGTNIKIIGAGGSTPAIVHALSKEGAKNIIIYNRTLEKAQSIANVYNNVSALPLTDFEAKDCDILINTTSVGLSKNDRSPVESLDEIAPNTAVYDIIYSPPVTKLMKMASGKGCKVYNGYKLLIFQGLIADEIWFGKKIINDKLVQKIMKEMSGD